MLTKRDIIKQAFTEIGLGSYNYDLQPEDYEDAVRLLDRQMAVWSGYGIETGYPVSTDRDSVTLDSDIGLILQLEDGVVCTLAVSLGPPYGREVPIDVRRRARAGYVNGLRLASVPPMKGINTTNVPSGAGYKHRDFYETLNSDGPDEILPGQRERFTS